MRYQFNKRFQAGTSMVYVLAALIVTGFIGGAMIKMMGSERTANALYATSASARNAAKSGIIAAIHKFEDAGTVKTVTIPLLQKWIDNPLNPPELIASGTIGTDQKYTTKLMAFDPKKFNITLMSEGIGKGGARAAITSVYYLDGLYYDQPKGNVPTNALQLDNGNFEFNCNVEVFGNTSVKDKIIMNNGLVKFHGHFRIDTLDDGTAGKADFHSSIEFDSGAYFAGNIEPSNTLRFKGNVGFAGKVKCASSRLKFENAGDSVYFIEGYENIAEGRINLADDVLFLYNTSSSYKTMVSSVNLTGLDVFTSENSMTSSTVPSNPAPLKEDVDYLVSSVFQKRDTTVHLNIGLIDTIFKTFTESSHETITATKLNNWYNAELAKTTGRKLWNGYLVLKFEPGGNIYYPFSDDGTKFNGKVIIINNDKKMRPMSFYESGPNGVTVLYFNDYNTPTPIFGGVEYFRGLIYVKKATNGGLVFEQGVNSEIEGSVYYSKDALSKFDGSSGVKTTFRYNKSIMDDLAILGIFTSTSDVTTKLDLKTTHSNLIASLVSQSL